MKSKKITLDFVKKEIHRMDKGLKDENGEDFKIAVLLLSSAVVGPNVSRLRMFTGYPKEWIHKIARNARKNKIWQNGKIPAEWFKKNGSLAFFLDCAVAAEYLEKKVSCGMEKQNP